MFAEYIQAVLERAEYKVIDNPEPIFGEAPELEGGLGHWHDGRRVPQGADLCHRRLDRIAA